jgi:2-polyprenyl-6-methoxyphenol hydroxylase-like FAD-dependent oxidoreductase
VVVGAGTGGLAASLVLGRVVAQVTLVERAERPSEVGAALALQPNGMAVLDRLGLLSTVEAASARIDRMEIRSVTSGAVKIVSAAESGRDSARPVCGPTSLWGQTESTRSCAVLVAS